MTYQRFEDLPVWNKAADLYKATEEMLEDSRFRISRSFRDQLERAALSVSNNIAEGFERGTTSELLAFIYIARGSAGEVRSMLAFQLRRAEKMDWTAEMKSQISNVITAAESCSRQLRGWADSLQNSPIPGQRHLNDAVRRSEDQGKRAAAMQKKLLLNLPKEHPLRRAADEREEG